MLKRVKAILLAALLLIPAGRPAVARDLAVDTERESPCSPVSVFEGGSPRGEICAQKTDGLYAVIDLADDWVPAIFTEAPGAPQPYRQTFIDLANERTTSGRDGELARSDRYYELFGIFPSPSVVRRRLLDEVRHACHAAIDDGPLRAVATTRRSSFAVGAPRSQALSVVQAHLRCEGMLANRGSSDGRWDGATREALALYQRRHMLPLSPVLDVETKETFLTPSRELDFRTLLRVLRERVVDATGLIEDGSALNAWEPVLGRFLEATEYRQQRRPAPLPGGAPDLVARATEAAARALGWTSPEAAAERLGAEVPARVALRLPPAPAYHAREMALRVEIDRGDVWTSYPLDAEGRPRPSPVKNRATLTVIAQTSEGDVPLVRWPTTIGAWKPEKQDDGSEGLRYKGSPVGRFYWRDLVAAPAWFPPPTTPDHELVRRRSDGAWESDQVAVGPGYRSAYGLIALLHHQAAAISGGAVAFRDDGIRTHGSGNYRSILTGSSHGCHRLFNHLALRLGAFLLAHRRSVRGGSIDERYGRTVRWKGHVFKLRAESRGYRYQLEPPLPVDVLPGRPVRSKARPAPVVSGAPAPAA